MTDDKISRWRAHLERAPDDELARFTLAKALLESGRLAEARDEFRLALRANPEWLMAHVLLGRTLLELGERAEGRAVLERGRELAIAQGHDDPRIEIEELLEEGA